MRKNQPLFKRSMLLGSAAVLLCGSARAADAPAQTPVPATMVSPAELQVVADTVQFPVDDDAAQVRTKVESLQKQEADLQKEIAELKSKGLNDNHPSVVSVLDRLAALRIELTGLQLKYTQSNRDYALARAMTQQRLLPLLKERDSTQLSLAEASNTEGPNSARVTSLRNRLQILDVQIASINGMGTTGSNVVQITGGTFVGLATQPVAPALAQQLKLQAGFGLMVQSVVANSPAEAAGIKRYDVLTRMDDQLLITPVQLETLIRSHKEGDEVKFALIHEGQSSTVTAKLSTGYSLNVSPNMEVPTTAFSRTLKGGLTNLHTTMTKVVGDAQIMVSDHHLTIDRTTTHESLFDGPVDTAEQRKAIPPEYQDAVKQMLDKATTLTPAQGSVKLFANGVAPAAGRDPVMVFDGTAGATSFAPFSNEQLLLLNTKSHVLVLTLHDGKPAHLLVKDPDGNTLFDGPVDTADGLRKIPAAARDDFDHLVQHPETGEDLTRH